MRYRLIVSALMLASSSFVCAQEPPLPVQNAPVSIATVNPSPTPAPTIPQLMPVLPAAAQPAISALQNTVPNVPALSRFDQFFKETSLGKERDEYRLHVEWRQLQDRVANDPHLLALQAAAEAAPTDLEKRDGLRAYYNAAYARMKNFASSPAAVAYLEQKRVEHVGLLAQPKVRPTPVPATRSAAR